MARRTSALLRSLCLHGLLAGAAWLLLRAPAPPPHEPLLIELTAPAGGHAARPSIQASKPRARVRGGRPALGLGLHPTPAGKSPGGAGEELTAPDGYAEAEGMGLERESRLYPFYEALWKKIDAATIYPADFAHQRLSGAVTIQLPIDRRGVFRGRFRSIEGDDPMLAAYVAAVLAHALDEPLPASLQLDREAGILVVRVEFTLFGPGGSPRRIDERHFRNVIQLARSSYVEPKLNEQIEKFFTRYVPPIIPIPGGFYIDFFRAYELVRNLASETPDPDALRARRLELERSRWDDIVQRRL